MPRGPRPRAAHLPVDASRALEGLLGGIDFDVVHVHDPFVPSLASAALRHSSSLNVGGFYEPSERILSTQVARPLVEIFLGRLDARTVSCRTTAQLIERFFPGPYEPLEPGADAAADPWWPGATGGARRPGQRPLRIAFCLEEERGALRLFLRAVRRLSLDRQWEVAVLVADSTELRIAQGLRERVRVVRAAQASPESLIAAADVLCVASGGPRPAPGLVRMALAAGTVPVASQIALYDELLGDGERGLLFPPGDAITLAGQLERLLESPALRQRAGAQGPGRGPRLGRGHRSGRVDLRADRSPPPRSARQPRAPPPGRPPTRDPRRPAHAHRSLARLRDAGRDAARDRPRGRSRGDRDHRPQRGLGCASRRARSRPSSGSR